MVHTNIILFSKKKLTGFNCQHAHFRLNNETYDTWEVDVICRRISAFTASQHPSKMVLKPHMVFQNQIGHAQL